MYQLAVEALHYKARNQISGQPLCISGAQKKGKNSRRNEKRIPPNNLFFIYLFSRVVGLHRIC